MKLIRLDKFCDFSISSLLALMIMAFFGCDSDSSCKVQTDLKGEFKAVTCDSEPSATLSSMNFSGCGTGLITEMLKSEDLYGETFTYTTEKNGYLSIIGLSSGAKDQGIVSYDYSALATITTYPSTSGKEGMKVAIPTSINESNSDLEGNYLVAFYGNEPFTALSAMSFDGSGKGNYREISSSAGDFLEGTLTYSLKADGSLAISFDNGRSMSGIMNSTSGLFSLFGSYHGEQNDEVGIGIRKDEEMHEGLLTGDYVAIDYTGGANSGLLKVSFDGNGSGTIVPFDDLTAGRESEALTYKVDEDGSLSITTGMGRVIKGIVSYDGTICTTADTDSSDGEIGLSVYILEATWFEDNCLDRCEEEYTNDTEIEHCYEGCLSYMTWFQNNRKELFGKKKKDKCDYAWRSYCYQFYYAESFFKKAGAYAGYLISCLIFHCEAKGPFSCPTP